MHIYLIRHAVQQSLLCNDNTHLSELGRQNAAALGERLSSYGIQAIYSSDFLRAKETAQIINDIFKNIGISCPHIIRRGLRETDFGRMTGLTDDTIAEEYNDFMESRYHTDEDWSYPDGENGSMVWERFFPVLEEILNSSYENVAVVTHGGTIRCALSYLFGRGFNERLVFAKKFRHSSITEIKYDRERDFFSLERFNDYAHIENSVLSHLNEKFDKIPTKKIGRDIRLILASASARRRDLLKNLNISFDIIKSDKEENCSEYAPSILVKELSKEKVLNVAEQINDKGSYVILGADTVVVSPNGMVIGKPKSREEAIEMISTLSGHTHSVYTGVTIFIWENEQGGISTIDSFYVCSRVTVAPMSPAEIEAYVDSGESMDKAGAYAIQGLFAPYITRIEGDYYNVVGLPVAELRIRLRRLGIEL